MSHIIQSVLFDEHLFNTSQARKILKGLNLISNGKVHKAKNFLRFRQIDPKYLKGYKYYTHPIHAGILEVIAYKTTKNKGGAENIYLTDAADIGSVEREFDNIRAEIFRSIPKPQQSAWEDFWDGFTLPFKAISGFFHESGLDNIISLIPVIGSQLTTALNIIDTVGSIGEEIKHVGLGRKRKRGGYGESIAYDYSKPTERIASMAISESPERKLQEAKTHLNILLGSTQNAYNSVKRIVQKVQDLQSDLTSDANQETIQYNLDRDKNLMPRLKDNVGKLNDTVIELEQQAKDLTKEAQDAKKKVEYIQSHTNEIRHEAIQKTAQQYRQLKQKASLYKDGQFIREETHAGEFASDPNKYWNPSGSRFVYEERPATGTSRPIKISSRDKKILKQLIKLLI